ncbi:hypothetical protein DN402_08720 [Streptomyces sp. SW4]|nr:hypothetical protein DN402_08720 [Streptomyces sp. SW4]
MTSPETIEGARVLSLPTVPAALPSPPPGDIVVGAYLRTLRRDSNRTAMDIAKVLHLSLSAVSQMERAASPLAPSRVRDMLRLYGLRDQGEITVIQRLLADPRDPQRFRMFDNAPGAYDRLAAVQRSATTLRSYTAYLLPRPYRTPGYDQALRKSGVPRDIGVRPAPLGQVFPRPGDGARFTLLLDDAVLRRPIGGHRVMACQLEYLLELMEAKRARVLVVPPTNEIPPLEPSITEVSVHGHRLYMADQPVGIEYRSGDGYPQILRDWLNEVERACAAGDSHDRITRARDVLWSRAAAEPIAR